MRICLTGRAVAISRGRENRIDDVVSIIAPDKGDGLFGEGCMREYERTSMRR